VAAAKRHTLLLSHDGELWTFGHKRVSGSVEWNAWCEAQYWWCAGNMEHVREVFDCSCATVIGF